MMLGRVAGRLVSTIHHPAMQGRRLLLLELLGPDGAPDGRELIAVDAVGAGAGETVLVLDEGNGARQVLDAAGLPVRSVVVGIVDTVTAGDQARIPPATGSRSSSAKPSSGDGGGAGGGGGVSGTTRGNSIR